MRMLRVLLAFALVCGLTGVAKAQAVDFQMVVVDPTYSGTYTINPITDPSFTFLFTQCESPGQLPLGVAYDGCFTGQNETGTILTSLELEIPLIVGQVAGCSISGTGLDIFSNPSCTTTASGYLLDFTGGTIAAGELFTIAEDGVDVTQTSFPTVSALVSAPEPRSISLLAVDVLMSVGFIAYWRRRVACAQRP